MITHSVAEGWCANGKPATLQQVAQYKEAGCQKPVMNVCLGGLWVRSLDLTDQNAVRTCACVCHWGQACVFCSGEAAAVWRDAPRHMRTCTAALTLQPTPPPVHVF